MKFAAIPFIVNTPADAFVFIFKQTKTMHPAPPYYAVIFTAAPGANNEGYAEWDARMFELVKNEEGYLGHESYQNADGTGVTISYWKDLESIAHWKNNHEHQQAQELGKLKWYAHYRIRVCKVERDYAFPAFS